MKRRFTDRIQDRLWRETRDRMSCQPAVSIARSADVNDASVSSSMPWAGVCAALADGTLDSRDFRRLRAVNQVVETVGLTEARHYVRRIREWNAEWLQNPRIAAIDDWGNPIRCPRLLLGTSRPFSPTTLRYLATALWLQRSGKIEAASQIVEIGVGFGGLAAINALVSGTTTILVDLPQVEQAALRMLSEVGLAQFAVAAANGGPRPAPLVISNYAFSELSAALQDAYLEKYLRLAKHGVIVSNASVFASGIGGRSDEELVEWLQNAGIPAVMEKQNDLLTPIDELCRVSLIHW